MFMYVLALVLLGVIMLPLIPVYRGVVTGQRAKNRLVFNLASFGAICLLSIILPFTGVFAESATAANSMNLGVGLIGAALSTGMASIGAGIAVASAASAGIGAASENPKMFGRSLIFVTLGEGVALYGLIVSIMILGKI